LSPTSPQDPSQGAPGEEQTEQGADVAAGGVGAQSSETTETPAPEATAPEATGSESTSQAEGTAAAETGVDKTAAEAIKSTPRRRDSRSTVDPDLLVRAQAKYVRSSARKARLVCDQIRGKDVAEAQSILAFTPRAVAKPWSKLLASAIANAEHNHELIADDLRVVAVYADEGPTIKRFRPRAMGRATSIRKRTSHLTIALGPKTGPNRKAGR
jgi:ribosomal protein L22